jgi:UDP-N-acetylglucosamine 2-epimerase (non-hydrolysing)
MRIVDVVGARPNFMKMAPVHAALRAAGHDAILVHTGQHYDANMSKVFFEDLGMPRPDVNLEVGSGSHAAQTARIMETFEPVLLERKPDAVLVAGDVNSTIACALVAVKLGIRVAHLEAGLRSFDWSMPEEINRILTDRISHLLLTPSPDADANLHAEGVGPERIARVGNAMIDSLRAHLKRALTLDAQDRLGVEKGSYALVTLHRPAAVDDPATLRALFAMLETLARDVPVVFPVHPRTAKRLADAGLRSDRVRVCEPLGYLEFLGMMARAKVVLTDSGGVQEETTALGVPCLTLRDNTERPITVSEGTNELVGTEPGRILEAAREVLRTGGKVGRIPELWDGRTGGRVAEVISRVLT